MSVISVPEGPIADENNNPTPAFIHFVNELAKLEPVNDPVQQTYPQIEAIEEALNTVDEGVGDKDTIIKFSGSKVAGVNIAHGLNSTDIDFSTNNHGALNTQQMFVDGVNEINTDFDCDIIAWKVE